jgi:HNH endonuclease
MNLPSPFAYSTAPHARSHGPRGYKDYADFKPFLRDEFAFRCAYCLDRERWYPNRGGSFSVDHFSPKAVDPGRETDYDNLVYACVRCNSNKQAAVVGLDPTTRAFGDHFRVDGGGRIEGLSPEAADMIDDLKLNDEPAIQNRRSVLALLRLKERFPDDEDVHALFLSYFGYPDDLPDLARLRPPGGNARPDGIAASHFERRKRGELPDVY